jgi:hypothetical protein
VKRYVVIVSALVMASCAVAASSRAGTFESSDPELNAIWKASVATAEDMLMPGPQQVDAFGDACAIDVPVIIEDGSIRDRCPCIGDEHVTAAVFDVSTPDDDVRRNMLRWFGDHQLADGAIPSSPIYGGRSVLFDYNAYWLMVLHRYVLYSGDRALARELWPHVRRLARWFDANTLPSGLLDNPLGPADYAFIRRRGTVTAYFNAQAAVALRETAQVARWISSPDAAALAARANRITAALGAFWDPVVGAFADSTTDFSLHPQDGNVFAVLAGVDRTRARRALAYQQTHSWRSYGSTLVDGNGWDDPAWGYQGSERVYPFIGYDELLARFSIGLDRSALQLIRLEWGYMLANGPGRMWELISPFGGGPIDQRLGGGWDMGWSAGAAPALTDYVLGVQPMSPGFATFTVRPHPGDLAWARGTIDTPHGPITVSWRNVDGKIKIAVRNPPGTRFEQR